MVLVVERLVVAWRLWSGYEVWSKVARCLLAGDLTERVRSQLVNKNDKDDNP